MFQTPSSVPLRGISLEDKPFGFFDRFRHLADGGYFTTPQGMTELGYEGKRPSLTFDGPTPEALKHVGLA